ncbi:hypothetical protein STEG23_025192, partial [Scotinomys teguina]
GSLIPRGSSPVRHHLCQRTPVGNWQTVFCEEEIHGRCKICPSCLRILFYTPDWQGTHCGQ